MFQSNPDAAFFRLGIPPVGPAAEGLRHRLMDSNEPFSTFALANSLAGFLVGPMALGLAVALENLRREGKGSRLVALAMAAIPGLAMLTCLVLTKSRSAYLGLLAAVLVLGLAGAGGGPREGPGGLGPRAGPGWSGGSRRPGWRRASSTSRSSPRRPSRSAIAGNTGSAPGA